MLKFISPWKTKNQRIGIKKNEKKAVIVTKTSLRVYIQTKTKRSQRKDHSIYF